MIARLRRFFEIVNRFMGRVWMTVLYFSVVLPFGVVARFRSRNLHSRGPVWSARNEPASDLAEAREQS